MSNTTNPNAVTAVVLDQKSITGVDKYYASVPTLLLAGVPVTPASLKAIFQADIDATNALDDAEASLKQVRAKQKAARKAANATRLQLKAYIVGTAGAGAVQMLEDFGFAAPKPKGQKTVATKATAIAKSEATRAARHTMGKRQRAAIHGTVAPAATPAASATAPAPSPAVPTTTSTGPTNPATATTK